MKIVCYAEGQEKGLLLHYPSMSVKAEMLYLLEGVKEKYNGFMTVTIDKPYKSRTTGRGSQNNLFWKLVQIICNENGDDPKEIERDLKIKAIAKGYPYHVSKITGLPVPESTTKINTVEMSYLIDTAYEVIAFLGITLERDLQKENNIITEKPEEQESGFAENAEGDYDIF